MPHFDLEYRIIDLSNDSEYIENLKTLKQATKQAEKIKAKYGDKLVLLDILYYTEREGLTKHIQLI